MIRFVTPTALAGLLLALGPLLIHLLQRRQARRAIVPTVRFVPTVSHSSLRFRNPDDVVLLVMRTAAIAAAALALAGPVVLTAGRTAAWNERIVRAVVVDMSASAAPVLEDRRIASELDGAYASVRLDADRLRDGLRRAANWLDAAPPGRREAVVVSDFQHGSLTASDLSILRATAGIRLVRAAAPAPAGTIQKAIEYYGGVPYQRDVTLEGWSTALTLSQAGERQPTLRIEGASGEQAARLERIVREAGAVSSRPDGTVVVRFGGSDADTTRPASGQAGAALLRLLQNEQLAGVGFSARAEADTLIVTTVAEPSSFEAATLVHAAVSAWRDPGAYAEAERESIPDETLRAWTREAAPADPSAWRQVDQTDARWFWILALLCLTVEWLLRRRVATAKEQHARAA